MNRPAVPPAALPAASPAVAPAAAPALDAHGVNIAAELHRSAVRWPARCALRTHAGDSIDFAGLAARADALAHGLAELGLARGERVSLFLRPGIDLVATTYALFQLGCVPVLIDPGMGRRALAACVAQAAPRALIAVPEGHLFRRLHPAAFRTVELALAAGSRWAGGGDTLDALAVRGARAGRHVHAPTAADDAAAVLFTSGSTGPAKGVVHTHGNFAAQVRTLRAAYGFRPGEVDVACFPLFALFDVAFGMTAVFPDLDPSRPGRCDPAAVARALIEHEATNTFGSPAIWRRVMPWCAERGIRLEHLERVLIAGAPVPPRLVDACHAVLGPAGDVHTPYGATEALPVASITGREITGELRARSERGEGTCVGRPAPEVELVLIPIGDEPLAALPDAVAPGALGEVCVRGPVVTRAYLEAPQANAAAKIPAADGRAPWHRMGDVGYVDDAARLWFCGRKAHRLETARGRLLPVPFENVVELHPAVRRAALVGVGARGAEVPTLVVEPAAGAHPRGGRARTRFAREIAKLVDARATSPLAAVRPARVLFERALPVDARHNAKLRREEIKRRLEGRGRAR